MGFGPSELIIADASSEGEKINKNLFRLIRLITMITNHSSWLRSNIAMRVALNVNKNPNSIGLGRERERGLERVFCDIHAQYSSC